MDRANSMIFHEFIAGWWGGVSGLLVGHPFDTVKSRLQTQGTGGRSIRYHSTIHCFTDIIKTEGFRGLYKGMTSPLLGMAAINATIFGVYGICMRHLQRHDHIPYLGSSALSGAASGLVQSFICSPVELIKLRMQVQGIGADKPSIMKTKLWKKGQPLPTSSNNHMFGVIGTAKEIVRTNGLKGLSKGIVSTLYREGPAFSLYFFSYDGLCLLFAGGQPLSDLGPLALCFAGGISGINAWLITYPVDVIKSRIQVDGINGPPQYRGMWDCIRKSYQSEGWRVFFKGLNSTLIRAFPVNAATFSTVTYVLRYFRNHE